MTHPMGRNRGGANLGCFGILILLGVLIGAGAFIYSNVLNDESSDNGSGADTVVNNDQSNPDNIAGQNADGTNPDGSGETFEQQTERRIFFPNAETAGTIVEAYRKPGGWEVGHLQQLVGHLEGTPWLDQDGNMVLAGHFEDELGRPGPFRYLYFAEVGDRILIQEGDGPMHVYVVNEVFRTDPNDLEILRKTDSPKLTLITCDSWSYQTAAYEQRLVVVAEPVGALNEGQFNTDS